MTTAPGVTVDKHVPELLRVVSNGNAPGAGMRIYVPLATTERLGLRPGAYYRFNKLQDGRIQAVPVSATVREALQPEVGPTPAMPSARIRLELDADQAKALEAYLAIGDRTPRSTLVGIGKQLRKRMKAFGWTAPDRTDDVGSGP